MDRFDPHRRLLAFATAGLAGYVDAIGFLSADGYFVSFMSGNTTRLAVDIADQPAHAVIPALLITGFVAGVAGGTWLAQRAGRHRKPANFAMVGLLVAVAALLRMSGHTGASLGPLVFAMGAINTSFQREGSVAVGVTYMTGALVRLGEALGAMLSGQRPQTNPTAHLLLWASLATGAILGAVCLLRFQQAALFLAVAWSAGLALAARALVRRAL
jgi:uncharacterized membrane protein YoaK (UPF0700 family)